MRRVLAALLASVMLACAADARTLIIRPKRPANNLDDRTVSNVSYDRNEAVVLSTIKDLGGAGNYLVVDQDSVLTEWARTGLVRVRGVWEQFDGVIALSYAGSISHQGVAAGYTVCHLDSLTRLARGGLLVPHLWLNDNSQYAATNGPLNSSISFPCSLGVAVDAEKTNGSSSGIYYTPDPSIRWQQQTYVSGFPVTQVPPGGLRKIVQTKTCARNVYKSTVNAQWPDSLINFQSNEDTTAVWERLFTGLASMPNAKRLTFATWHGAGFLSDSLFDNGVVNYQPGENEGTLAVLHIALAHYDSLIGRALFTREPAKRAIVVKGGLGRGLRRLAGGFAPADTSAAYSSCDSLASWGVPVTFAINVNPDSATAYARDLIKLKSIGTARFTPYIVDGANDSIAVRTSRARLVDPLGRFRPRTFFGDTSATGSLTDTSYTSNLKRMKFLCDSLTGGRTTPMLVAYNDDWSPPSIRKYLSAKNVDSLYFAIRQGGFMGVIANGQSPESDLNFSTGPGYHNPRGATNRQGWYSYNIGRDRASQDMVKVLTFWGQPLNLGKTQFFTFGDSSGADAEGSWSLIHHTLDRAYGSWFNDRWENQDMWRFDAALLNVNYWSTWRGIVFSDDDFFYHPKRAHVLMLSMADLSGAASNPARGGLYVIRSIQQATKATNLAAGRTLVQLAYPDEVQP